MSRGYPRPSTGSRNQRLRNPSARRAASTSASEYVSGYIGTRSMVTPTLAPGASRRSTSAARPCASSTWCAAASASSSLGSSRSVHAQPVAEPRDHPRLVLRDPVAHAIAEPGGDDLGVLRERLDRVARRPAAAVLERLRQVPVVERDVRLDAARAARRRGGRRSRARPGSRARARREGCAATRSRSGTRRGRARGSGAMSSRWRWYESQAIAPVSPFTTFPGTPLKRSQMLSPRPSSPDRALDLVGRGRGSPDEVRAERGRRVAGEL